MKRTSFEIKMEILQYLLSHKNVIITHIVSDISITYKMAIKYLKEMAEKNLILIEDAKSKHKKNYYSITSFGRRCFMRNRKFWGEIR